MEPCGHWAATEREPCVLPSRLMGNFLPRVGPTTRFDCGGQMTAGRQPVSKVTAALFAPSLSVRTAGMSTPAALTERFGDGPLDPPLVSTEPASERGGVQARGLPRLARLPAMNPMW